MKQAGMTLEKAQLILENEAPSCGRKLTFTSEERYEAYRMGIKALEKQLPKKPITDSTHYAGLEDFFCPSCKKRIVSRLDGKWCAGRPQKCCEECGQALDWSDT